MLILWIKTFFVQTVGLFYFLAIERFLAQINLACFLFYLQFQQQHKFEVKNNPQFWSLRSKTLDCQAWHWLGNRPKMNDHDHIAPSSNASCQVRHQGNTSTCVCPMLRTILEYTLVCIHPNFFNSLKFIWPYKCQLHFFFFQYETFFIYQF